MRNEDEDPLETWKRWSPAGQETAAELLRQAQDGKWRPFYCKRPGCDGQPHPGEPGEKDWAWNHARADQVPPPGDWLTWLLRGGRGAGKTRTGAEWTHRMTAISPRIALVAPTGPDARDIMVEGESGILATSRPGKMPQWEPSKRRLTWPNGALGSIYSGEEPDRLRGPQHHNAWVDEPAHIDLIEQVWDNLLLGLRLGAHPRICATTTPKPSPWMRATINDPTTVSVQASTYLNLPNLSPVFRQTVMDRYEGTRKGRQELHGELIEDVEGSLWRSELIELFRVDEPGPDYFDRIVVSVDPAGTAAARSDETGIIVVAARDKQFYVLADASGRYSPETWAQKVVALYDTCLADKVVVEKNYGGDMVRSVLRAVSSALPVEEVTSRRGKALRAEPIEALYEQGRVHHIGLFNELEDQMTSWVPGNPSPDRLDALVHGITALTRTVSPSSIAVPMDLNWRTG